MLEECIASQSEVICAIVSGYSPWCRSRTIRSIACGAAACSTLYACAHPRNPTQHTIQGKAPSC